MAFPCSPIEQEEPDVPARQRPRGTMPRKDMRITRVQAFLCDAGWRPWTFVKVDTDDGLVGWGECSDSRNPHGVAGSVRDLEGLLLGEDARAVQRLYWDMLRNFR